MSYGVHLKQCPSCGDDIPRDQRLCRECRDEKVRRHRAVSRLTQYAVSLGVIPSPRSFDCQDCGAPATCYDHRDYNRPLDVDPVCMPCNSKRGRGKPRVDPLHTDFAKCEAAA